MSLTLLLKAEVPLLVHLIGMSLWLGAALAARFVARSLHRNRDFTLRRELAGVARGLLWGELAGAALTLGSGVSFLVVLLGAAVRDFAMPNYLFIKMGLAFFALVGSVTAFVCVRKAEASASRSIEQPNAAEEDRFDRNRRGYGVASLVTLVSLLAIVALSTVRPPW
jgi:hypothetical protein